MFLIGMNFLLHNCKCNLLFKEELVISDTDKNFLGIIKSNIQRNDEFFINI